jgi:cytochrome c553
MPDVSLRTAALAALIGGVLAVSVPVLAQQQDAGSTAQPAASDTDIAAAGKQVWNAAACYNCHGTNGQGGHSPNFPAGPSLRKSQLDPESMLLIIECGIPDTRMPAWLEGAYTEVECYGDPVGPLPSGILVSGAFSQDDLKNLVAYIQTNFMKQPMPEWTKP